MPSIDGLAAATGISDGDELPVSQSGTVRRATRAQIIAGVQPQIVLSQGQLLGRLSAGAGTPEPILIGANLTLAGSMLSAPKPYDPSALPTGNPVGGGDLVPVAQGGVNVVLPYGQFMAGLSALSGFDLSQHRAAGTGTPTARSFAAILADAAVPEEFGAAGDGTTDDTAALAAAAATGRPVRLGPRAYAVRGQWTIAAPVTLLGTPGLTRLVRPAQDSGGAWISVQAAVEAHGISFDATCPAAAGTWGVLVTSACPSSLWVDCQFLGTAGPLGCGLCILPALDTARHRVWRCEAAGNASHGVWIRSGTGAELVGCFAHDNAGYGLCVDDNDPQLVNQAKRARIAGNQAWSNARGISVGNPNQTNAQPPFWGLLNPDVVSTSVEGNRTWSNADCGIAACGDALLIQGNRVEEAGTGLQVQASRSRIAGNQVFGGGYGIDLGGSAEIEVSGNQVLGARIGINPGGGQGVRVQANHIAATEWAITAYAIETDGQGVTLGPPASDVAIVGNRLEIGAGGGVLIADGVVGAIVRGNQFTGTDPSQALVPHTASLAVHGNLWNDLPFVSCTPLAGTGALRVPEALDEAWVPAAPDGVALVQGTIAAALAGQITWLTATAGGSGYTQATVTITGDGQGAQATVLVRAGAVIGFRVTAGGAGYTTATVSVSGDGQGAQATAQVGLPVPDGRQLVLRAGAPIRLAASGVPGWAGMDAWLAAGAVAELRGSGGWFQLAALPEPVLTYPGAGAAALTPPGDLYLRPGGAIHLASAAEPFGCSSLVGRGSPQGAVVAAPGSDYRNLDGGVGQTLWLKQAGTDANGWAAIA